MGGRHRVCEPIALEDVEEDLPVRPGRDIAEEPRQLLRQALLPGRPARSQQEMRLPASDREQRVAFQEPAALVKHQQHSRHKILCSKEAARLRVQWGGRAQSLAADPIRQSWGIRVVESGFRATSPGGALKCEEVLTLGSTTSARMLRKATVRAERHTIVPLPMKSKLQQNRPVLHGFF